MVETNVAAHEQIVICVHHLMGVCDGAYRRDDHGFNRYDADWVRRLVSRGEDTWTARELASLRRCLQKYRKQLDRMGLDVTAIPAITETPSSGNRTCEKRIEVEGQGFAVIFPYDPDEKDSFKAAIRRRQFIPRDFQRPNRWWVPNIAGPTHDLVRWIQGRGFEVAPEVWAAIVETTQEGEPPPKAVVLSESGQEFGVRFGGSMSRQEFQQVLDDMRSLDGRRWDAPNMTWWVPINEWGATEFSEFVERWGFEVDPAAQAVLTEVETIVAVGDEWEARSRAAEADAPELAGFVASNGDKLHPFQRAGILTARDAGACIIADEMGLGKTIQGLGAAWVTFSFPLLVICQSTKKTDWAMESEKWLQGRTVIILEGEAAVSMPYADVVIANWDIIHAHVDTFRGLGFKMVLLDEAQYMKETKSRRTKAALQICEGIERVHPLTGTPIMNRPLELLPMLQATGRLHHFAKNTEDYKRRWCGAHVQVIRGRKIHRADGSTDETELHARLRRTGTMIRRLKADVLTELPPLLPPQVLPMPIDNRDEYNQAEEKFLEWIRDQALSNEAYVAKHRKEVEEDAAFMAAISMLPDDEHENAIREELAARRQASASRAAQLAQLQALKLVAARGVVRSASNWLARFTETGKKVVVFAHHQEVQNALADAFPGCARIMGGSEGKAHNDTWKERFAKDPNCRVMVASLMAGGTGHNLTSAYNTLHVELGWTPASQQQGDGRCHRIGQQHPVQPWIIYPENTIYEYVVELLDKKRSVVDAITDGRPIDDSSPMSILPELMAAMTRLA